MRQKKIKFYLINLPIYAISIFYFFCLISAFFYPGSEKEIINFKSESYSFTHNFFSELGCLKTNTDETNPNIIKQDNTLSMVLFNSGLVLIGITLIMFYYTFEKLFIFLKDEESINYSKFTKLPGILSGIFFSGVGFVPHDLDFGLHVFFANGAFLILFFLCVFHTIAIYKSNYISNLYSFGYLLFCFFLLMYVVLIFFGPQISPGKTFTENELILQVVSQKVIVLIFTLAILSQVYGINDIVKKKSDLF
tara:strand:+ start:660 stop:1409 length:750 start_codon:yes stop_codon:yes gene_type:complete